MDDDASLDAAPTGPPPEEGGQAPSPGETGTASRPGETGPSAPPTAEPPSGRPLVERIGMAAIALLMAGLFGVVAVAAFAGGEVFLAAMGAVGCLMTIWAGAVTLRRG